MKSFFKKVYKVRGIFRTLSDIVSNKAKGRISKRVFQENKALQIFLKTNIFRKIWRPLFSWNTRFEIRPKVFAKTLNDFKPLRTCTKKSSPPWHCKKLKITNFCFIWKWSFIWRFFLSTSVLRHVLGTLCNIFSQNLI